jgi:glycosyltransferase involved in cell wall biosynthesis
MKTICILSNAHGYGGAEKSIELIVQKLIKMYKVIIYVENSQHGKKILAMNSENLKVISLKQGKSIMNTLINIMKIRKVFIREDIIMFLANTNKGAFYLAILSLLEYSSVKNILVYIRDFQWRYLNFITWSLKNAKFLLPSQALLDKENYIKRDIKPYITGNPVDVEKRQDDYNANYILTLANISRWKGLTYLLEAYYESHLFELGIQLRIYGNIVDEGHYNELVSYIKEHDLANFVFISPFIDEIDKIYTECLFVVNSSIGDFGGPETFGRTIIEAWSHGKAAISFNVGGPKYIIDTGRNGFLVEEKNIKELSEKMSMLVLNRNLSQRMGVNGLKKVTDCYRTDKIIEKLKEIASI